MSATLNSPPPPPPFTITHLSRCFNFENGEGYLVTDVSIVCGSDAHAQAKAIAILAILLYPIGLFVLNGSLLVASRRAILDEKPSSLSVSTAFLHGEYKPVFYLWELMEMGRRVLLVGVYVVGPYHPGSLMQLAMAAITCVLYTVFQTQSLPYRSDQDNYLAVSCSLSLVVLFIASIFYKVASLTELQDLQSRMSFEQREDFVLPTAPLSVVLVLSVTGTLGVSALVVTMQAFQHARERQSMERAAKARRLRFQGSSRASEVVPRSIAANEYHLFLS